MSALEQAQNIANREQLRRDIAKRIVYQPLTHEFQQTVGAFAVPGETRVFALNFSAGVDFQVGARHWFDAKLSSQEVLSVILNDFVWMTGKKEFEKKTYSQARRFGRGNNNINNDEEHPEREDVPIKYNVTTLVETIPAERTDPTKPYICAGYRLWFILVPKAPTGMAEHLLNIFNEGYALGAGQRGNRDDDADVDGNGNAAGGGGGSRYSLTHRRAAQVFAKKRERWIRSPLTMAHLLGCSEASALMLHVGEIRKKVKVAVPEPHSLRSYRYARFPAPDIFHTASLQPFFNTYDKAEMPHDDYDNFLQVIIQGPQQELPVFDRRSPYNLDSIFVKERAMVYKTTGGEFPWKVSHCRLDSYIPGAHGRVEEGSDIDPTDENARLPMRAYLQDVASHLSPLYLDTAQLSFPTPSLTYVLADVATVSEVLLSFSQLPWAIGQELPAEAFEPQPGDNVPSLLPHASDLDRLDLQLESVARLRDMEATHVFPVIMHNGTSTVDAHALSTRPITDAEAMHMRAVPDMIITQPVDIEVPSLATAQRRLEASQTPRRHVGLMTPATPARNDERRATDSQTIERLLHDMDQMDGVQRTPPTAPTASVAAPAPAAALPQITMDKKQLFDEQYALVKSHLSTVSKQFRMRIYDEFNVEGHANLVWKSTHTSIGSEDLVQASPESEPGYHESRILEKLNEHAAAVSTPDVPMTSEIKARVMERTDVIPSYFIERNDFLGLRPGNQIQRFMIIERQSAERQKQDRDHMMAQAALATTRARQAQEVRTLYDNLWTSFFATLQKTDNASAALLQARDYAFQHLMSPTTRECDVNTMLDSTSFAQLAQFLVDSFVGVDPVSAQNMPYLLRLFVSAFHAHRYQPNRKDPALNYLIAGKTGTGKSFLLNRVASYALEGIVQNMTTATTASYNVAQDFDHTIIMYEEMDAALLMKPNDNVPGSSDRINYAKARMTSFCTWTQYFYANPDTGKREAHRAVSSQHVVVLGATNQNLDNMDDPMRRRINVDFVFEISAFTDGGKPEDNERWSMFLENATGKQLQHKHLELHWAYMVVELAIRAGVIDDVLDDGGRLQLRNILAEASRTQQVSTNQHTRTHWILEAARTLAILDACYNALYSVDKVLIYETPESGIKRWSPLMFSRIITPGLRIDKEHIQYAIQMFDYFFASRDEQRLIGTIAETLCSMSDPSRWTLRRVPSGANGASEVDPNYLVIKGGSDHKILSRISEAHKHISQPRPEDISTILLPYQKKQLETRGMELIINNENKAVGVKHSLTAPVVVRQALFFENDPTNLSTTRTVKQLCVSFEFIESRYGINFETATAQEIRRALVGDDIVFKSDLFADDQHGGTNASRQNGLNVARSLAECTDKRSPMVGPIRRTLSHKVLWRSPYEHREMLPVPKQCFSMHTFYTPDDIRVSYDNNQPPLRIPQQGTQQILELRRDPSRSVLRYDNYARPLPTASVSVFGINTPFNLDGKGAMAPPPPPVHSVSNGTQPNMSLGFVADIFDVDFDIAFAQMRKYCNNGNRLLESFFLKQCEIDCGGVQDPSKWARLLRCVPEIRKLHLAHQEGREPDTPLPFNFKPIDYRIRKYARRVYMEKHNLSDYSTTEYSAINIFARVQDSVIRRSAIINQTPYVFESYSTKLGHTSQFDMPLEDADGNAPPTPRHVPASPQRGRKRVGDFADAYERQREEERRTLTKRARTTPASPFSSSAAPDSPLGAGARLASLLRQEPTDPDAMDIDEPVERSQEDSFQYF